MGHIVQHVLKTDMHMVGIGHMQPNQSSMLSFHQEPQVSTDRSVRCSLGGVRRIGTAATAKAD